MILRVLSFLALSLVLLGCQSRERELPARVAPDHPGWATRLPESPGVAAYAAELESLNPEELRVFSLSDGVSLVEAEAVALVFNASLRRARLEARVPLASARNSGLPEDPRIELDLLRVLASVSNPWVAVSGLQFTVPLSGRLASERRAAFATASTARHAALLAELEVVTRLRKVWSSWSASQQRVALLEEYLTSVAEIVSVAKAQRDAEQLGTTKLRVLLLEEVSRQGDLLAERARAERLLLDLKSIMGVLPDTPVDLRPSFSIAQSCSSDVMGGPELVLGNPELAQAQADFRAAEEHLRLQVGRAFPDLEIGPLLESEEGIEKLGVGIGVPLPLWNKNRQAIAEACAARRVARQSYQTTYEDLVARVARAAAQCRATSRNERWLSERVAPMADQQLSEVRALGELGDMDVLLLKDALSTVVDTKLQLVQARLDRSEASVRLRALIAPLRTPASKETVR